jgi:beta-carotene ketolase (CrtW type)
MENHIKGVLTALTIMLTWFFSLIILLRLDFNDISILIIPLGILWQTLLYTGLFITAHDAMHGSVYPKNRKFNDKIGSLTVALYALFSYKNLLKKHRKHHQEPGSKNDPDFHSDRHGDFFRWYIRFMSNYLTWKQFISMAIVFNILLHLFRIESLNLILFWIFPSLLSTLQLFYFGTYLPHRDLSQPFIDKHRARSNNYSVFWSFLTCYHFGYHWEHHEYPSKAWWKLPKVRRMNFAASENNHI